MSVVIYCSLSVAGDISFELIEKS